MKWIMMGLAWLFGLVVLFVAAAALVYGIRYMETVGTWDGEY